VRYASFSASVITLPLAALARRNRQGPPHANRPALPDFGLDDLADQIGIQGTRRRPGGGASIYAALANGVTNTLGIPVAAILEDPAPT
jgi:hypothetical protein